MKGKIMCFFVVMCIWLGFISCSNVTDEPNSSQPIGVQLKYLDIVNAKSLYISTSSTVNRSAGNSSSVRKIFKITETGYVEEVKYLDEDKNEISISQQPAIIQTVNDDYIFVGFGTTQDYLESSYLVRKSDGAVFDMENVGHPQRGSNFVNVPMMRIDRNNNLYFITSDYSDVIPFNKIVKVDLSGSDFLNTTVVSPSTDSVSCFDVDWNGNIIYNGSLKSNDLTSVYRIRTANGRIRNLGDMAVYWVAPDDNIYFQSQNYDEQKKDEYDSETGEPIVIHKKNDAKLS